jgi:hypothetical protein
MMGLVNLLLCRCRAALVLQSGYTDHYINATVWMDPGVSGSLRTPLGKQFARIPGMFKQGWASAKSMRNVGAHLAPKWGYMMGIASFKAAYDVLATTHKWNEDTVLTLENQQEVYVK